MEKEDRELLLKDLSARLPYGVKVSLHDEENGDLTGVLYAVYPTDDRVIVDDLSRAIAYQNVRCGGFKLEENNVKPYLRPMSSMTEEEREEWADLFMKPICELEQYVVEKEAQDIAPVLYGKSHSISIDWLNSHHFDYRGLIEKGLALEAPEGMYT